MPSLDSDLSFGVSSVLICSFVWKNASGPLGWSDDSRRECDSAWKGDAPMVLFSNRIQLWLTRSPINVSECWLNAMRRNFLVWQYPAFLLLGLESELSNPDTHAISKCHRREHDLAAALHDCIQHPCIQSPSYITGTTCQVEFSWEKE